MICLKAIVQLWVSTIHANSWKTVKKECHFATFMTTIIGEDMVMSWCCQFVFN